MNNASLFKTKADWREWLNHNHVASSGLWLRLAKKNASVTSITYGEAIEVALCFGWIDGQKKPESDAYWLQRFTPRRPKSIWSKINCAKALGLIEQGAMEPAGLAEVERAKADGRWDNAYDGARTIQMSKDLEAALTENSEAAEFFKTLNSQNRYAILFRVTTAVKPETRAKRIKYFTEMLARREKPNP
jgi:uncharacterized protein YdeI (YjbR/CyaY-like superfamily)